MNPLVTTIIPVYNREALVGEAIESALRASSEVPIEIIVVDDASTDGTWNRLRAYDDPRIRCEQPIRANIAISV